MANTYIVKTKDNLFYCSECGKELVKNEIKNYCYNCGKKILAFKKGKVTVKLEYNIGGLIVYSESKAFKQSEAENIDS